MIYYDSYKYFESAVEISHGTTFDTSPFLIFLSLLYKLFKDPGSVLVYARIINVIFVIQLIIFFYLIARKIFDPFISVIGTLMVLFIPILLAYSVTLHNDIFSLAMGFTALYFSIMPKRLSNVLLATVFVVLTGLTRTDIGFVFVTPYFIGLSNYLSSKIKLKMGVLLGIFLAIFYIPAYFVIQNSGAFYSGTLFQHSILRQVITFVNFDAIKTVLQTSVDITSYKTELIPGNDILNNIFLVIVLIGIVFFIYNNRDKILKILREKSILRNESSLIITYLILLIIVSVFTLAAFHLHFQMINNSITVINNIEVRYVIGLQLFILYIFMYGLSLIVRPFHRTITNIPVKKVQSSDVKLEDLNEKNFFLNLYNKNFKNSKNREHVIIPWVCLAMLFVVFIIFLFAYSMWNTAMAFYGNNAPQIATYYEAAPWIAAHLGKGENVFLPSFDTFWVVNQTLKNRTYEYTSIAHFPNGTRIYASPIITPGEKMIMHQNLVNFAHNSTNNVKYVVIDWVDSYGKIATNNEKFDYDKYRACKNFDNNSIEVKRFNFKEAYVNWGSSIIVCKV